MTQHMKVKMKFADCPRQSVMERLARDMSVSVDGRRQEMTDHQLDDVEDRSRRWLKK